NGGRMETYTNCSCSIISEQVLVRLRTHHAPEYVTVLSLSCDCHAPTSLVGDGNTGEGGRTYLPGQPVGDPWGGNGGGTWTNGRPRIPEPGGIEDPEDNIGITPVTCSSGNIVGSDGLCYTKEDIWEQKVCTTEEFNSNPCLTEIWDYMNTKNVGFELLTRFIGDDPIAELCIDLKAFPNSNANGQAVPTSSLNDEKPKVVVTINPNKLDRSKFLVARTLLHELIHAELFAMIIEAGGYNNLQEFSFNYEGEDKFKMLWEYYDKHGKYVKDANPGFQHQFMAQNYVQYMKEGLSKLSTDLLSSGFKNYISNNYQSISIPVDEGRTRSREIPFSWGDFYESIAWEGLMSSSSNPEYKIDAWENLSELEKAKIKQYQQLIELESSRYNCMN
ncbi:MAG: hypothetical protein WBA74_13765, partial [Cyclobacteriaceae bacterium]